jgi:hypothetical protein
MIKRPADTRGMTAFHQLFLFGFFFAMRSCENFKVYGDRRTHPIRKRNIAFIKNHKILPHDSPDLELADAVTVTFEYQKRDERNDSVTQSRNNDPVLCPVRGSAAIVRRLQAMGVDDDAFVFTYESDTRQGKHVDLTGPVALKLLRQFVSSIDYVALGLDPKEIGLHSCRSSSAMAMYINKVPVYTIMLLGRWSSDAFLRYIRKQCEEFGHDVLSTLMIQRRQRHHVPNPNINDPRSRRNPLSFTANHGIGTGTVVNRNAFSVWG